MANIIIGTAGHIDHGKSTLIGALTGIETDTTKEEKDRGMSINLGFAYFDLPSGKRVGIIDVPGHERFIKNMLAGAQGINMILLVIDANEGIMPQTVEHLNILTLLGLKDFIVVLTKADLQEEEYMDLLEEEIRESFQGTPVETAQVIRVDSVSRRGLDELVSAIDTMTDKVMSMNLNGEPRLNVDRVFSVKGFGTVVTGTLLEGTIHSDQDLILYPAELPVKVRQIQVHEKEVPLAQAGQRTAINLSGVKMTQITRGDIITTPGNLTKSFLVDARVKVLQDYEKPLKLWDRVRVYLGTREIMARVVPLGVDVIAPGEEGFVQLRMEEEVAAKPNDRIILRAYSPMITLGGGIILDPATHKHGRFDEAMLKGLELRDSNDADAVMLDFLMNSKEPLVTQKEIMDQLGEEKETLLAKMNHLKETSQLVTLGEFYISADRLEETRKDFSRMVKNYHQQFPLRVGMPKEELKSKMKTLVKGTKFDLLLNKLSEEGTLKVAGSYVSLPDFTVKLSKEQQKIRKSVEETLQEHRFDPPSIKELAPDKKSQEVLESMEDVLVKVGPDMVFHREAYQWATEEMLKKAKSDGSISLAEFRDLLNTSRKYAVALLDFYDRLGVTKRQEDVRVLTGKEVPNL